MMKKWRDPGRPGGRKQAEQGQYLNRLDTIGFIV
jgi:hypothetical protein